MYTERHDDRYGGRVPSKKRKTNVTILKIIPSLTGSQWSVLSNGLTCSCLFFAKSNLRCIVWKILQPVHLITVDDNEQRTEIVQPPKNKRKHQLSSGFRRQEMADRTNSSDLEICCTTDVVNTMHHSRQWRLRYFRQGLWRKCQGCQLSSGFSCDTLALLRDPTKTASGFVVAQL